jgi:hypothetical protein
MAYVSLPGYEDRAPIDGIILQAAVSDREAMSLFMDPTDLQQANKAARQLILEGKPDSIVPVEYTKDFCGAKCTASRWLSLSQRPEDGGEEDFFSSDLTPEDYRKVFGSASKHGVRTCIMWVRLLCLWTT